MTNFQKFQTSKLVAFFATFFLSFSLFAQTAADVVVGTVANPLGAEFEQLAKITAKQGRVIFYRGSGPAAGAASVFINGGYQTSLVHGGYSQICLPPSQISVGVRLVENGKDVRKDFVTTEMFKVTGARNVFIRVNDQDTRTASLSQVTEEQALAELKGTRLQIHTLSRVRGQTDCEVDNTPPPAPPAIVALEKDIQFSADRMFAFGKSDLPSMLPDGRAFLQSLSERIATTYKNQENLVIQIVGHADPFTRVGESINTRLSLERAQTVGEYFVSKGLQPSQILTYGKGSSEPIVTDCGTARTQANFDCNRPNRRVVVTIGKRNY